MVLKRTVEMREARLLARPDLRGVGHLKQGDPEKVISLE
jgi:hypothetical protein